MSKLSKTIFVFCAMIVFSFYYVNINSLAYGDMGGMGHGMMGMDGGSTEKSTETVNPENAKSLLSYIKDEHLQCMQCHAVSKYMFGPSFAAIAENNKDQKDAMSKISNHIVHGVGRMPPGYANSKQARVIARQILGLISGTETPEAH